MSLSEDELQHPAQDGAIVDRIVAAVMEQKLPPGAKLPEAALCEAFACSRTQIRRILVVLAERGVVALHSHRGAFVASPDGGAAREVFEARRAIERPIALAAAAKIGKTALAELRANAKASAAAEAEGRRGESILLSGQFHLLIAEAAGNSIMAKFLEDLVARTSLIIGLYGSRRHRDCPEGEHEALIEALAASDGPRAADLMERHLKHIEGSLDMHDAGEAPVDIRGLFAK